MNNCAIAHSVYYALVLLPGFEEHYLHGNVVAYRVLVQLLVDHNREEALKLKAFLQTLDIPTNLREMEVTEDMIISVNQTGFVRIQTVESWSLWVFC